MPLGVVSKETMRIWISIKSVFRDFLESSSINGIVHISKATSNATKCSWSLIISLAFIIAVSLINNSYVSWNESPFITTVETFPISQAPFPVVTICPPTGTNTALNYDIAAAKYVTWDNDTRVQVFKKANISIFDSMLIEHVNDNVYWADNEDNVKAMLLGNMKIDDKLISGTQSSRLSRINGEVIKATGTRGSIRTPRYDTVFDEQKYRTIVLLTYRIIISKDIPQNSTAIVELMYDTKESEGGADSITIFYGLNTTKLQRTGRQNLNLKYHNLAPGEIWFQYSRSIYGSGVLDVWDNKRETG